MNMHDRQDEVAAILAQIAMIAEDVNVIGLQGSGADTTHNEQLACVAEVNLRVREMFELFRILADGVFNNDTLRDIAGEQSETQ